jgi:hypothetical protein
VISGYDMARKDGTGGAVFMSILYKVYAMQEVAGTGNPSITKKGTVGLIVTLKGPFTRTNVATVVVGDAGNITLAVEHGLPLIS